MSPASGRPATLLICCGALAHEMLALVSDNDWTQMRVECLPAKLHNTPEQIPDAVRRKIRAGRAKFDNILVLYSDCGTGGKLDEVLTEENVERIGGTHCYEAYLGAAAYAALIEAEPGSFFLTDYLVRHFDRLILKGLGLDRFPKLRDTYFRRYKKLVYLAQTEDAALEAKARAAADRLGLDFEKRFTGYGGYRDFLAARLPARDGPARQ